MKAVIGLTGGIGSGKSAVADIFAGCGAAVVDTDAIAHSLSGPGGAAMAEIRQHFGASVIAADGSLDRAAMRSLAFSDATARSTLEAILHPLIRAESARQVAAAQAQATVPYVILVVPLLVESGTYTRGGGRVDRVCVVDCPEPVQIDRVMRRSGLAQAQVEAIMATQATREQRCAAADDLISNAGTLADLAPQVLQLDADYRRIKAGNPPNAGK